MNELSEGAFEDSNEEHLPTNEEIEFMQESIFLDTEQSRVDDLIALEEEDIQRETELPTRDPKHLLAIVIFSIDSDVSMYDVLGQIGYRGPDEGNKQFEYRIRFLKLLNQDTEYSADLIGENHRTFDSTKDCQLLRSIADKNILHNAQEPARKLSSQGCSIGLTIDLGTIDENAIDLQYYADQAIKEIKRKYHRTYGLNHSQVMVVLLPPLSINSALGAPLSDVSQRLVSYTSSAKIRQPGPLGETPRALLWTNPRIGNVKAAVLMDPRFDQFNLRLIMECLAAQGTLQKVLSSFSIDPMNSESIMNLSKCTTLISNLQSWLERKCTIDDVFNSEMSQALIEIFANRAFTSRLFLRVTTQAQIGLLAFQNSTLEEHVKITKIQNDLLISIQQLTKSQNKNLKAQRRANKLQDQANRWAGRFSTIAAAIAVIISTTALFAGLAAIPKAGSGMYELLVSLNLALTIVAGGASVSFLFLMARDWFLEKEVDEKMMIAFIFVLFALLVGILLHNKQIKVNILTNSSLVILLLVATFFVTNFSGNKKSPQKSDEMEKKEEHVHTESRAPLKRIRRS